jgi:hypothetical protein
MQPGPYPTPGSYGVQAPSAKDESDLNLLSMLHYVWSGLIGCGTLGMVAYFVVLGGLFGMSASSSGAGAGGSAAAVGMMVVIAVIVGLMMTALFVLHLLAASGLKKRNRRTLTYVASALMCTSFPLGTALGVFTIIILGRPGVKALYGAH